MNVPLKLAVFISGCALVMFASCDSSTSDKTPAGTADSTPPAEVSSLLTTPGDECVTLTWTDPADADFHHVEITVTPGDLSFMRGKGENRIVVPDLTNDTEYTFTVISADADGNLSDGETVSETPVDATGPTGPMPTVTTAEIAGNLAFTVYLTGTKARAGGEVTDEGDSAVTERGVCWNTTGSPDIDDDSKWASGSGTGEFADCYLRGLSVNTVYHVRAYATNSEGTAYGSEITFNSGWTMGNTRYGGLVFYNDGNGHGLVAYAENLTTSMVWTSGGSTQTTELGTTRIGIGSGLANTNAIVAQAGHTASAAQFCLDYSYNDGETTYDDWFLPSWDELGQMYAMLKARGTGNFTNYFYWSSSEYNANNAFMIYFATGEADWDNKNPSGTTLVRPVRAF
ncbi:MAG TPA: DUF1566 domain-containing protein [Spirochaetota bacterium]|nr:DUF1566 domain-containing protein [Spirochaetota bacterium]HRZ26736.1 DUF1566 domain-containing protein [Spirochaetota bacterium]HSA13417.1 DUF1566 domain-containing protein [Spirochaetota bacterium]